MKHCRWSAIAALVILACVGTQAHGAGLSTGGPLFEQLTQALSAGGTMRQDPGRASGVGQRDIMAMQRRLDALGYPVGVIDGQAGGQTQRAIARFQADNGLPETGMPDARTLEALSAAAERQQPAPAAQVGQPGFQILNDTDLPYGDYRSGLQEAGLRRLTLERCRSACAGDDQCQSFTYNVRQKVCFLKQTVPASQPFRGAISGIKIAAGFESQMTAAAPPPSAAPAASAPSQRSPINQPIGCLLTPPDGTRFVCGDGSIQAMDTQMTAAVATIQNSASAPPDFPMVQQAWVQKRNACNDASCVARLYLQRLAQIAPLLPNGGTNELANADIAANSQRVALQWNIPLLRGRLYLPNGDLQELRFSVHEPPVMAAWKHMLLAAGLAAKPDFVQQLDDTSLDLVGCVLLDEAAQQQLGGKQVCDHIYQTDTPGSGQYGAPSRTGPLFAGAEFATRDFARRFAAERLPAIIARAPRLPLQLVKVIEVSVSPYDTEKGQFLVMPIFNRGTIAAFNSPTDLVIERLVWPIEESGARAFAARQSDKSRYSAFLAIPLTLTGVIEGQAEDDALPGGYRWQVEAGDPVLYDDEKLSRRLYAFPPQERLPTVMANKAGEKVPLFGEVPLNNDTMLLALIKVGAVTPDRVDWPTAARNREDYEGTFHSSSDWRQIDPWGVWFAANAAQHPDFVARFKDWTLRRAASLPERLVVRQSDSFFPAPKGGDLALGQGAGNIRSDAAAALKKLAPQGIDAENVVGTDYRIAANTGSIMVVAPLPISAYVIPDPGPDTRRPFVLETAVTIQTVETIGSAIVLHVMPVSAVLRHAGQIVSRVDFPSMPDQDKARQARAMAMTGAQQAQLEADAVAQRAAADAARAAAAAKAQAAGQEATAQKTAQQQADSAVRAAADAYLKGQAAGPDVLGVRLGMSVDEAEAAIRKAIGVGWILENADNRTNFDAIEHLRIYVSPDKTDMLALLLPHADEPQRVIGVERVVSIAPTVPDAGVEQLLIKKYGVPSARDANGHLWVWGDRAAMDRCALYTAVAHNLRVVSGPPQQIPAQLLRFSNLTMRTPVGGPNVADLGAWAVCSPLLRVSRESDYIFTALWDMRALVAVATSLTPDAVGADGTPAIKF